MTGHFTLPAWLVFLLAVLAAWTVVGRLLVPAARWLLRRKVNLVLEEIGKRLHLEIQPFALTKRQVLIDRLMHDPKVMEAAVVHARENRLQRDAAMGEVERYAREIVPSFNAWLYFRAGYWLARKITQVLYRVRVALTDEAGLSAIDPKSSVVFVMNHRSNMDYILVAYLAATRTALSYAVGEWARVWPLQAIVRSMGAYFIRRDSRNPLYRLVLERYVAMATEGGVVQAIYPEGGLTKDGSLRPAKLGLLDYMTKSFDPSSSRDVFFIPVGINYDRTFEDRSQMIALDPEADRKSFGYAFVKTAGFFIDNLLLALRGRWYRFGYACVSFGSPLSLKGFCARYGVDFRRLSKEERFRHVETLAGELMASVGKVIPVLPVSLVATALFNLPPSGVSELELKAECHRLILSLSASGAHVYMPRRDQDYAVDVGLRMLTLRHLVREEDGLYSIPSAEVPLLRYYANSIRHLLPAQPASPAP